jgi:hypothetical protein
MSILSDMIARDPQRVLQAAAFKAALELRQGGSGVVHA